MWYKKSIVAAITQATYFIKLKKGSYLIMGFFYVKNYFFKAKAIK